MRQDTLNKPRPCVRSELKPWPPTDQQGDADLQISRLAKALGHPARVAIVRMLLQKNECVCGEIVDQLPLAQSTVSQHLKKLKEVGLIQGEVDGPRTCYWVNRDALAFLAARIGELSA